MNQSETSRKVVIGYSIRNAPAVVTLDIQTNASDGAWISIGPEHFQTVQGDVYKLVEPGEEHRIRWFPEFSWPENVVRENKARAVVTAWAVDNTPDYMVVDLAYVSDRRVRYYPDVESLPGGLFQNSAYRTTMLVLKKVVAKDVTWSMGSGAGEQGRSSNEVLHTVTLTNNFYLAVFETTQGQWAEVMAGSGNSAVASFGGNMRPMEMVSYNDIRDSDSSGDNEAYRYPAGPNPASFLGRLSARTGIAFDLPSDAQWEYACRAGHGDNTWGDGTPYGGTVPGFCASSGGSSSSGTAEVGTKVPNSWGFYDMHGNLAEYVLDRYLSEYTDPYGAPNTSGEDGPVKRGGQWNVGWSSCRSAARNGAGFRTRANTSGFRIFTRAELK